MADQPEWVRHVCRDETGATTACQWTPCSQRSARRKHNVLYECGLFMKATARSSQSIPSESGGAPEDRNATSIVGATRGARATPAGSSRSPAANAGMAPARSASCDASFHVASSKRSSALARSASGFRIRGPLWAACRATINASAASDGILAEAPARLTISECS